MLTEGRRPSCERLLFTLTDVDSLLAEEASFIAQDFLLSVGSGTR